MKTKLLPSCRQQSERRRGFLQFDLVMGLAILTIAVVPVGFSFARERQALLTESRRYVINELVDGEMEILAAGAAKNLPDGSQTLPVPSRAATSLPPGHFQLAKTGNHLQLTWLPDEKCGLANISREATLQ
ncbi:MAG TPA: hypothetical protein VG347_11995 [Verrucomicrobiae bacterium]|nr:hypothetical protein [Verrucomicrobiae bacterium]